MSMVAGGGGLILILYVLVRSWINGLKLSSSHEVHKSQNAIIQSILLFLRFCSQSLGTFLTSLKSVLDLACLTENCCPLC